MTESEFIAELTAALDRQSEPVRAQLPQLLAALPERATRLDLEIFPAQDGDGFFTVRASVDGPDLYVINKAIGSHAALFDTKYTESGVEPPIPIVDCFDVDYPVNHIIVDCTAKWLQSVWQSLRDVHCRVPVLVVGHEGYGTATPIELHPGAVA
ncbi:DUF6389 family protein [Rhodopirellula sp. SWK7]|uniref:DUF6389 family protein n=1 Tax=Rhodopirellula sp. SWK7 TaxID=595460 RepID=UPI0002BF175C|nr:DUF6389 family protein [Rhodopirellula sp. SWK7]EMI46296.1 hypothetical protein RRSWK_01225 [Rhodopirellula sp. SWK7]